MGFLFTKLTRYILFFYVLYAGTEWVIRNKSYNISPKAFKSIASQASGVKPLNAKSAVTAMTNGFGSSYRHLMSNSIYWHSVNIGGLSLKMNPLFVSLTEYASIIGSPFGGAGRVGFHWSNSTCTVLTGSVSRSTDSSEMFSNRETFTAGKNFRHGQFESYIYNVEPDTYVACYGRGVMPVSGLSMGLSSVSNGEPMSAVKLFYHSAYSVYQHTAMSFFQLLRYYQNKVTGKSEL